MHYHEALQNNQNKDMATVINNPSGGSGDQSGAGFIIGLIVAILIIILFIMYGLPAIRGTDDGDNTTIIEGDEPDTNVNLDPNPDVIVNPINNSGSNADDDDNGTSTN